MKCAFYLIVAMMIFAACNSSNPSAKEDQSTTATEQQTERNNQPPWPQGKTCYTSTLNGQPGTMTVNISGTSMQGTFETKGRRDAVIKGQFTATVQEGAIANATFDYTAPPYKIVEKVMVTPTKSGLTFRRSGDMVVDGNRQPLPDHEQRDYEARMVTCGG